MSRVSLASLAIIALYCAGAATLPAQPEHTNQTLVVLFDIESLIFYRSPVSGWTYDNVSFGGEARSGSVNVSNDTTDDNPLPFAIENDARRTKTEPADCLNVTISASDTLAFADSYSNMTICIPTAGVGVDCGNKRSPTNNGFSGVYNLTKWVSIRNGRNPGAGAPDVYNLQPRNETGPTQGGTFIIDVNLTVGINETVGYHSTLITATGTATTRWLDGYNACAG